MIILINLKLPKFEEQLEFADWLQESKNPLENWKRELKNMLINSFEKFYFYFSKYFSNFVSKEQI